MDGLSLGLKVCAAAALALLVGCVTPNLAPKFPPQTALSSETSTKPRVEAAPTPQTSPTAPAVPLTARPGWLSPGLDVEGLSFGWVTVPQWPERLGVDGRFWTEDKVLWKELFQKSLPAAAQIYPLKALFAKSRDDLEKFWAAFWLYRLNADAGLSAAGAEWRQQALALRPSQVLALEQIWDLAFVRRDLEAARAQWRSAGDLSVVDVRDQSRKTLLRQYLFLGTLDLVPQGLDPYVSSLALDHDDLWIGTWNGGLARLSVPTGEWTVLARPVQQVAPVRLVRTSKWFVYVFKEHLFSRYSKVTGGWRDFAYPPDWSGLRIQDILIGGEEQFWVAHLGQGLWYWDSGTWMERNDGSPSLFLNALGKTPEGLLVGTQDQGLFTWREGVWSPAASGDGPRNISAMAPASDTSAFRGTWAIGTYGEGLWLFDGSGLKKISSGKEFVTGIDWGGEHPWWGTLDEGLLRGEHEPLEALGLRDGAPVSGVTALVSWQGRLWWGTTGKSLGVWTEYDDPLVYR